MVCSATHRDQLSVCMCVCVCGDCLCYFSFRLSFPRPPPPFLLHSPFTPCITASIVILISIPFRFSSCSIARLQLACVPSRECSSVAICVWQCALSDLQFAPLKCTLSAPSVRCHWQSLRVRKATSALAKCKQTSQQQTRRDPAVIYALHYSRVSVLNRNYTRIFPLCPFLLRLAAISRKSFAVL